MAITRRAALAGVGALALPGHARAAFVSFMAMSGGSPPTSVQFQPLSIGGGGLVIGNDVANDGTYICWCDVFGLYLRTSGGTKWQQLLHKRVRSGAVTGSMYGRAGLTLWGAVVGELLSVRPIRRSYIATQGTMALARVSFSSRRTKAPHLLSAEAC